MTTNTSRQKGQAHAFLVEDAEQFGIEEAIILNHFRFLLAGASGAGGAVERDGNLWTRMTRESVAARYPYMTPNTVRRTMESLVKQGALERAKLGSSGWDQGMFYALPVHVAKSTNPDVAKSTNPDVAKSTNPDVAKSTNHKNTEILNTVRGGRGAGEATPEMVMEAWNLVSGKCPVQSVKALTPSRRRVANTRLKEAFFREHFEAALGKIRDSSFLTGCNARRWTANFDWFIRPNTVAYIMEGKYDDRRPASTAAPTGGRKFSVVGEGQPGIDDAL